jgi:hypothetical protein
MMDPDETCGCCEGVEKVTPMPETNRPSLDALAYRVGTHATFFETMQAGLTTMTIAKPADDDALHQPREGPQ